MITKNINGEDLSLNYDSVVAESPRNWQCRLYADGTLLDCAVQNLEITKGSCGTPEGFSVGNVVSSALECTLLDLETNVKGADIEVQIGLDTGVVEWITLGHFIAVEVKKTPYETTITGYGYSTAKAGVSFVQPQVKSLNGYATAISTAMGVDVVFDSDIPQHGIVIRGAINATSCYEGLQALAHLVGGYACDTYDGKIAIHRYKGTPTATIQPGRMVDLPTLEESAFTVTGVKVVVTEADPEADPPVAELSYTYGTPVVFFDENPNMSDSTFDLYKALVGYTYYTGTADVSIGDPRLEGDDVLSVVSVDGNTYAVPCHIVTHTYDGGLATTVEAVKATSEADGVYSVAPVTQRFDELSVAVSVAQASAEQAQISAESAQESAEQALESAEEAQRIVGELEDDVEDLNTRVSTAEGDITTIEGNITSLDGRVTTAEGKITTVEGDITALGTRVTTAEGKITAVEGDITSLGNRVTTAEGDITTIEGNITTINGQITTIEGNVSGLTTRVSTAEGKVTTLEGQVATAQGDISALQGRISDAESDITAVEGDITTLQGRVSDAEEDVTETLHALGVAEAVIDTINWITEHGTMTLTTDTQVDPDKVYFVVDPNGIYVVGSTHYSIVENPTQSGLSTYYELTTDSAISNYIESHIALTNAGLVVTKDNTKWYVLIKNDGIDIVDNTTGLHKVVASYGASVVIGQNANGFSRTEIGTSGMQIYQKDSNGNDVEIANLGYGLGNAQSGTAYAPYYTLGIRASGSVGNYSVAEGYRATASGEASHAEGWQTDASGWLSHAEGYHTTASGEASHAEGWQTDASNVYAHAEGEGATASGGASHAEGWNTTASGTNAHAEGVDATASGVNSHAQNNGTVAQRKSQTALGEFNIPDTTGTTTTRGKYAVIVGNGTANNARSNAYTLDWSGNVEASGDITDGTGNVLADKADTSSLATVATTGAYSDLSGTPTLATVATTGDYDDLINTPTLATVATTGAYSDLSGTPNLATVATSGDYDDLTDKPQINGTTLSGNKTFANLGLVDFFYPVGSYYETSDTTFDPNTAWGGTWSLETEGQVHISAGSNYTVAGALTNTSDGGEATHALTPAETATKNHSHTMAHTHGTDNATNNHFVTAPSAITIGRRSIRPGTATAVTNNYYGDYGLGHSSKTGDPSNANTGGQTEANGSAHNNMQPYIAVNRWHRTA